MTLYFEFKGNPNTSQTKNEKKYLTNWNTFKSSLDKLSMLYAQINFFCIIASLISVKDYFQFYIRLVYILKLGVNFAIKQLK